MDELLPGTVDPLRVPLDKAQVELLRITWTTITHSEMWDDPTDWPKWDYVSRELHRQNGEIHDSRDVLASLPIIPTPSYRPNSYGLVWRDGPDGMSPGPGDKIGLTIAGLAALAHYQFVSREVPDALSSLIGALAKLDDNLPSHPHQVAGADVTLAELISWFVAPTRERTYVIPEPVIGSLLRHEYAPVIANPRTGNGDHYVSLGRLSLRKYRNLHSADDYLDRIAEDVEAQRPLDFPSSPLTLVQTFDYLGYVLSADPFWPKGLKFTAAPDLQSAAAVSATVSSRHEFETALNGLQNVINRLGVPKVDEHAAEQRFGRTQLGTTERLTFWLEQRLETQDIGRARRSLEVLRAVRLTRVEGAHGSDGARAAAMKARARLGLPEVISDWTSAWELIRYRLAGALDTIRQTIQTAPMPRSEEAH